MTLGMVRKSELAIWEDTAMSGRSWKTNGLKSAERESNMRDSCIRSRGGKTLLRHENLVRPGMNRLILNAVAPIRIWVLNVNLGLSGSGNECGIAAHFSQYLVQRSKVVRCESMLNGSGNECGSAARFSSSWIRDQE